MSNDNQLKTLRINRGSLKAQLTNFKKFVSALSVENVDSKTIKNLIERLNHIRPLLDTFNDLQNEIEILCYDDESILNKETTERDNFTDEYYNLISSAEMILSVQESANVVDNTSLAGSISPKRSKCYIKLPTINLPIFEGAFTTWYSFFDSFTCLIDNNDDLTNVEKLTYLKSSVKGEPLELIRTLESIDANYKIALDLLKRRYDNRRRIIENHVMVILNMPNITKENASQLKELINTIQTHINCLKSLGQSVDTWHAILVPLVVSKLDHQTRREWETKLNTIDRRSDEIPQLSELLEFLTSKLITLEIMMPKYSQTSTKHTRSYAAVNSNIPVCANCSKDHHIYTCESFLKLNVEGKNELVRKIKLCINCMRKGHPVSNCFSKSRCRICHKKHHTLLHINKETKGEHSNTNSSTSSTTDTNPTPSQSQNYSLQNVNSQTLLSTAIVHVLDTVGGSKNARVLLDSASQSNFITEALCERLNLKRIPIKMNVIGINQLSTKITHSVELTICSRITNFKATIKCLIVPNIASSLPSITFDKNKIKIPVNIKLADPNFNTSNSVDLLIGSNIFWSLICVGQIRQNQVIFQKTKLGWIVSGEILNETLNFHSLSCLSFEQLNKNVERFWQIDEFTTKKKFLDKDDEYCENYFTQTTFRDNDGRFVVRIPFKGNLDQLGDSFETAKSRFNLLEKRLTKNPQLKKDYFNFISEYINLGHMEKIDANQDKTNSFYLPHHCVIKEGSDTTKLRVVFDGSCKTSSGLSLNDSQFAGPTLQDDIFAIITRFRLHKYVLTGDIEKMYRQIWIHPDDCKYQRILWRENITDPISIYELKTVTYGTKSAPFLAIRCLMQLAEDNKTTYPEESSIIKTSFYVDDLIMSSDDLDKLKQNKQNIINILYSARFRLRKFCSNSTELLDEREFSKNSLDLTKTEHKTLGVVWLPFSDVFTYSFSSKVSEKHVTKRNILAFLSQLYDPLGLLAPIVIIPKLIIQEMWQLSLGWDETIPMNLHTKFINFTNSLKHINKLCVPRHVLIDKAEKIECHSFCDASQKAYGAFIFLKSFNKNNYKISLLAAKSRVAPLKQVTLPRLELCAAVLAAQLVHKFKNILKTNFDKQYFWCDSEIVLHWIKAEPSKWKTYVANRVSEIQNLSDSNDWFHVQSADNSADLISRGVLAKDLLTMNLWWTGPSFLTRNNYPISIKKFGQDNMDIITESRTSNTQAFNIADCDCFLNIRRFSNLTRLIRAVAYCLRFINNSNKSKNRITGPLTVNETSLAHTKLLIYIQKREFFKEYEQLRNENHLDQKSSLLNLTPFIDSQMVMRVGGRLDNSSFSYDKKHPILLPKGHHFTILIINYYHKKLMHAGPKLTLSSIRERYWPISGLNTVKKCIHACVICTKQKGNIINPIMGQLPYERTVAMYPFHSVGVDYAGPYSIKERLGRGTKTIKGYICLFICFATKALHLELVTNLTTANFLLAFKRFIARRGKPLNVFSDNGTNFVGANNELSKLYEFFNKNENEIVNFSTFEGINWKFIPPRSPTFAGLWEAGVKSVKTHLKTILSNIILTYEEFETFLIQIESILNSRPLTPLSSNPNDMDALSPAHFLIGRTLTSIPDPNISDVPMNRLSRYQMLQHLNTQFWRKWSRDYIQQLQSKTK